MHVPLNANELMLPATLSRTGPLQLMLQTTGKSHTAKMFEIVSRCVQPHMFKPVLDIDGETQEIVTFRMQQDISE